MPEVSIDIRTRLALVLMLFLPLGVAEDPSLEGCNEDLTLKDLLIGKAALDAEVAIEEGAFVGSSWQVVRHDEGVKGVVAIQEIRTNRLTGRVDISTRNVTCIREE